MNRLLVTIFFAVLAVANCQNYAQRATLYENTQSGGEFVIIPQNYVEDLATYNFDDRTRSVCVTGTWVFYVNKLYNTGNIGQAFFTFGPDNYCTDITSVNGISSVRYVGSPTDYRADSLTLFEGDYYQGKEEYFEDNDYPNINLADQHKSIIITGRSSWTVYDGTNFSGNAVCLTPYDSSDFRPRFIHDIAPIGIPHGTIKSIKQGC